MEGGQLNKRKPTHGKHAGNKRRRWTSLRRTMAIAFMHSLSTGTGDKRGWVLGSGGPLGHIRGTTTGGASSPAARSEEHKKRCATHAATNISNGYLSFGALQCDASRRVSGTAAGTSRGRSPWPPRCTCRSRIGTRCRPAQGARAAEGCTASGTCQGRCRSATRRTARLRTGT